MCITLENGERYTLVVAKPELLGRQMNLDGVPYVRPGMPMLFVERLTTDVICGLVEELVQNLPLLRLYGSDLAK